MKSTPESEFCAVAEAAALLGVSTETVRRRIKEGVLVSLPYSSALKQPAKVLLRRADVLALLAG